MADKSFGIKQLNLVGASGDPTVESPGDLKLNANTVAISTNATVGAALTVTDSVSVGSGVTSVTIDSNIIKVGVGVTIYGSAGIVSAMSFIGSGSGLTLLSASNIVSGTISDDRLPSTITSNITGDVTGNLIGTATNATNASNASNAQNATNATNATKATSATGLIAESTGYSTLMIESVDELPNNGYGSANAGANPPEFGYSMAVSGDNSIIAVSDCNFDDGSDEGRIYVYTKNSNSQTYNTDYDNSVGIITGPSNSSIGDQLTLNSTGRYLTAKERVDEAFTGISSNRLRLFDGNSSWSVVGISSFTSPNAKTVFNPRDESLIYDGYHTANNFEGEIRVYQTSNLAGVGIITFTDVGNIVNEGGGDKGSTIIGFGKKFTVSNINVSAGTYTDRVIAGIPNATVGSDSQAGAVALFDKSTSGNSWTQVGTIVAPTPIALGRFGADVAASDDGKTIIVTSADTVGVDWSVGEKVKVYIYKNVADSNGYISTNYTLDQTLEVEKGDGFSSGPSFATISCTSDANRIVISGKHRGTYTDDRDVADIFDRANYNAIYGFTTHWVPAYSNEYGGSNTSRLMWNYDQQNIAISKDASIGLYSNISYVYAGATAYGHFKVYNLSSSLPPSNQLLKTNTSGADVYLDGNSVSKIETISTTGVSAGATITVDLSNSNNYELTLDQNYTLGNPINISPGQSGFISIAQTAGGGKTLSWGDYWEFADGIAPTLTFDANDINLLGYYVRSTTSIVADIVSDIG